MNMRLRIPVIVLMQLAIYCDGGVKSGQFNRYKSEFGVSTTVPKYGVPRRLFEGDSYYESHASNIEEYAFKIDSKRGPKGNKHKNFTIDLHILGKGCRGLTICFGPKSNLEEHRRILQKIGSPTKDDKRYEMKLTEEVKNLINEGKYVVDACKGLSNWERLTFFHKHKNQKGIELMHGPYNYTTADSKEWFSTAQTTFYETTDIFDEEKNPTFYVVLAQAAQVCRARLKPRKITVAFMELQNGINFKPMTM
uniref:Uncharacterized protein n=1 Tax=Ascaris lumbricoides TaxID=6252 RepID=A0A0M3I1L8_ASCLU